MLGFPLGLWASRSDRALAVIMTLCDTTGTALIAGFCIAFMGIAADRLISTWARKRKQQLGLE